MSFIESMSIISFPEHTIHAYSEVHQLSIFSHWRYIIDHLYILHFVLWENEEKIRNKIALDRKPETVQPGASKFLELNISVV